MKIHLFACLLAGALAACSNNQPPAVIDAAMPSVPGNDALHTAPELREKIAEKERMARLPLPELEALAGQNHAAAQAELAYRYHRGNGVGKDEGKGRAWYEKAAANGDFEAQYGMGVMFANGDGVAKDAKKARTW